MEVQNPIGGGRTFLFYLLFAVVLNVVEGVLVALGRWLLGVSEGIVVGGTICMFIFYVLYGIHWGTYKHRRPSQVAWILGICFGSLLYVILAVLMVLITLGGRIAM